MKFEQIGIAFYISQQGTPFQVPIYNNEPDLLGSLPKERFFELQVAPKTQYILARLQMVEVG